MSAWLLRGMKPGPKSLRRVMSETTCMNDLEPNDIPLNFLSIYGRQGKVGERKKENMRERERERLLKFLIWSCIIFSWGPYYIRKFQKRFFLLLLFFHLAVEEIYSFFAHMIWSPLSTLLLT